MKQGLHRTLPCDLDLQPNELKFNRVPCPTMGNSHVKFEQAWMKLWPVECQPPSDTHARVYTYTQTRVLPVLYFPPPPQHICYRLIQTKSYLVYKTMGK